MYWRICLLVGVLLIGLPVSSWSQQYRSKILIDHDDTLEEGSALSLEQLEQQLDDLTEPYARASTTRHLARQYIQQGQYDKAIGYYTEALRVEGLSDIADREILRELARVHLLKEDYGSAALVLEKVLFYDLVQEKTDFLWLAQARLKSGDYVGTVEALDQLSATDIVLDEIDLRQVLALYYQSGAYIQSATVSQELLVRAPQNPEYWHQLATIYLLLDQRREALDHLSLAYEKRVLFREHNLLLLIDLFAFNNQSFVAARLLQAEIKQGRVTANGDHYRKLFELWLQAREKDQAITALVQAASLLGDTQLYLHLAQLQSEKEDWQAMQATVLEACSKELDDRYVSRANLLLGISLLKLGDRENARRSFINATLIGGSSGMAAQWLDFMNTEAPSASEIRKIASPCYGSSDRRRKVAATESPIRQNESPVLQVELEVIELEAVEPEPVEMPTVATRTVPGFRLFTARYNKPVNELAGKLEGLATRLASSQIRAGGEIVGPLHILVESEPETSSGNQQTLLAFPTRGNPRSSGIYRAISTKPFRCTYLAYKGAADGIETALAELARVTEGAGYQLNGQARFVFSCGANCTKEHISVELQLGIE